MTRLVMCFLAFSMATASPVLAQNLFLDEAFLEISDVEFSTYLGKSRKEKICAQLDGQPASGPTDTLDKKCTIATTLGCECEEDDDGKLTNCKPEGSNGARSSIGFTCTCKSSGTVCIKN